jgi:hypothetical protein
VIKKLARRAGLDPTEFSGHSLRSGLVTSANPPVLKIAEQTRHQSLDMRRVWTHRIDLFTRGGGFFKAPMRA